MIKEKIWEGIAIIGSIFSAIFYVLFLQKKEENQKINDAYKKAKEDAEKEKAENDAIHYAQQVVNKEKEQNADKIQNSKAGNHLNNFNDGIDLLSK